MPVSPGCRHDRGSLPVVRCDHLGRPAERGGRTCRVVAWFCRGLRRRERDLASDGEGNRGSGWPLRRRRDRLDRRHTCMARRGSTSRWGRRRWSRISSPARVSTRASCPPSPVWHQRSRWRSPLGRRAARPCFSRFARSLAQRASRTRSWQSGRFRCHSWDDQSVTAARRRTGQRLALDRRDGGDRAHLRCGGSSRRIPRGGGRDLSTGPREAADEDSLDVFSGNLASRPSG